MKGNGEAGDTFCHVKIPTNEELIDRVFQSKLEVSDDMAGIYDSDAKVTVKDEWKIVRHIPKTSKGWHGVDLGPGSDDAFKGTESYGEGPKTDSVEDLIIALKEESAWATEFDDKYQAVKVESADGTHSEQYMKG